MLQNHFPPAQMYKSLRLPPQKIRSSLKQAQELSEEFPKPGHTSLCHGCVRPWDSGDSSQIVLSLSPLPQEQSPGQDCHKAGTAETSSARKSLFLFILNVSPETPGSCKQQRTAASSPCQPGRRSASARTALTCRAANTLLGRGTHIPSQPEECHTGEQPESIMHQSKARSLINMGKEAHTHIIWAIRCLHQSYSKAWHCLTTTDSNMLFTSTCMRHLGVWEMFV